MRQYAQCWKIYSTCVKYHIDKEFYETLRWKHWKWVKHSRESSVNFCRKIVRLDTESGFKNMWEICQIVGGNETGENKNTAKVRERRQSFESFNQMWYGRRRKKVRLDEINKKSRNVTTVTGWKYIRSIKNLGGWGGILKICSAPNASFWAVYHLTPVTWGDCSFPHVSLQFTLHKPYWPDHM